MVVKNFVVSGMHCNSCAQIIEMNLEELKGVKGVKASYASGKVTVDFDSAILGEKKIIDEIKKAGYEAKSG